MMHGAKAVALNKLYNLNINVGETEHHRLRHLYYALTFAHCANWLVKLSAGCQETQNDDLISTHSITLIYLYQHFTAIMSVVALLLSLSQ